MTTSPIGHRSGQVDDPRVHGVSDARELKRSTGIGVGGQYSDIPSGQDPALPSVLAHAPMGVGGPVTSQAIQRINTAAGLAGNPSAAPINSFALPIGDALGLLSFLMLKRDQAQEREVEVRKDLAYQEAIGAQKAGAAEDLDAANKTRDGGTEAFVLTSATVAVSASDTLSGAQGDVDKLETGADAANEKAATDLDQAGKLRGEAQDSLNEADKLRGQAKGFTQDARKASDEADKLTSQAQDQRALANKATTPHGVKEVLNRQADQFDARAKDKNILAANLTQQATDANANADAAVAKAAGLNAQADKLTAEAKGLQAQAVKNTNDAKHKSRVAAHNSQLNAAGVKLMDSGGEARKAGNSADVKIHEAKSKEHDARAESAKKRASNLEDREKQLGQNVQQQFATIEKILEDMASLVRMHLA